MAATLYLATAFVNDQVRCPATYRRSRGRACATPWPPGWSPSARTPTPTAARPPRPEADVADELDRSIELIGDAARGRAPSTSPTQGAGAGAGRRARRCAARFRSAALAGSRVNPWPRHRSVPARRARPSSAATTIEWFARKAAGGMRLEGDCAGDRRTDHGTPGSRDDRRRRHGPRLVHLTTTDMSLDWLLGPQLAAFADAGYEVIGMSAPGPHVRALEAIGHPPRRPCHAHPVDRPAARTSGRSSSCRALSAPSCARHPAHPQPQARHLRPHRRPARPRAGASSTPQHGLYAQPERPAGASGAPVYALERVAAPCSARRAGAEPRGRRHARRRPRASRAARCTLLGNGIDLARFDPDGGRPPSARRGCAPSGASATTRCVVGVVGRLVREKGYREMFDAARRLRARRRARVRFVVIGPTDPDKADAHRRADDRAAAERDGVHASRASDRHARVLTRRWTCSCSASHREGFPRAAMEAAAMGLPIVATDIRGLPSGRVARRQRRPRARSTTRGRWRRPLPGW